MKKLLNYLLIAFLIGIANIAFAAPQPNGQIAINVLQLPSPMLARDKTYLVYELYVTNFERQPISLIALQVFDAKDPETSKFQFEDFALTEMLHGIGNKNMGDNSLILAPGMSKMIFVWLTFDSPSAVPAKLIHKLSYEFSKGDGAIRDVITEPMDVKQTMPVVVSTPVRGDRWVAGNGPSNISEHRVANIIIHGHDYFAQRYAIDFVQIGDNGLTYHGDENSNQSYICYGTEVHAVANGRVVAIKNTIPENVPHSKNFAVAINPETAGGNYVILDIGFGRYALFGHLIPGSVKVKVNAQVKQGEVIGKIGNSGNSTEPHLHFQIVDQPSFLAANGVPYAFDVLHVYPSTLVKNDNQFQVKVTGQTLTKYVNQLALENMVIDFDENAGVPKVVAKDEKVAAPTASPAVTTENKVVAQDAKSSEKQPTPDKKAAAKEDDNATDDDDDDDDDSTTSHKVAAQTTVPNNNKAIVSGNGGYGDDPKVIKTDPTTNTPVTANKDKKPSSAAKDDTDDDTYDDQSDASDNEPFVRGYANGR